MMPCGTARHDGLTRVACDKWLALQGILVPGGFGDRGVEGKIRAATYARENKIPYLGICLGMQTAVIEYARNVLGMTNAHSTEFAPATPQPLIVFMPEGSTTHMGGTMRLGARRTILQTVDCITAKLYVTSPSLRPRPPCFGLCSMALPHVYGERGCGEKAHSHTRTSAHPSSFVLLVFVHAFSFLGASS